MCSVDDGVYPVSYTTSNVSHLHPYTPTKGSEHLVTPVPSISTSCLHRRTPVVPAHLRSGQRVISSSLGRDTFAPTHHALATSVFLRITSSSSLRAAQHRREVRHAVAREVKAFLRSSSLGSWRRHGEKLEWRAFGCGWLCGREMRCLRGDIRLLRNRWKSKGCRNMKQVSHPRRILTFQKQGAYSRPLSSFASTSLPFLTQVRLTPTEASFFPRRLMYSPHPEGLEKLAAPSIGTGG